MTNYEAKFARERKPHPSHWLIKPIGRNRFALVYIGGSHGQATHHPQR